MIVSGDKMQLITLEHTKKSRPQRFRNYLWYHSIIGQKLVLSTLGKLNRAHWKITHQQQEMLVCWKCRSYDTVCPLKRNKKKVNFRSVLHGGWSLTFTRFEINTSLMTQKKQLFDTKKPRPHIKVTVQRLAIKWETSILAESPTAKRRAISGVTVHLGSSGSTKDAKRRWNWSALEGSSKMHQQTVN